jgi:hypothetical protein
MATAPDRVRSTSVSKHEAFVEQQLQRARSRIRLFDVTAALCGLLIVSLLYGLGMILLDRAVVLSAPVRQAALIGYILLALAYLGLTVVRPLCKSINPMFAALRVEETVPGAKNSVVNWLEVREQKVPGAIRSAIGQRAAKDVSRADLDRAVSARRVFWMGGGAFAMFIAAVVALVILGPGQFFSLFARAFGPFSGGGTIASQTQLTVIRPANGDATVPVNQPVLFQVQVDGKVPDPNKANAVRLLFRYNQSEPAYLERRLEPGDSDRVWEYRLPSSEVQNGFWYKIAGGDVETPEYRVDVRSNPLVTGFEVRYHYRPYLCQADQVTTDPNLHAVRGTEVTLLVRTNRKLNGGELVIHSAGQIKATETAVDAKGKRQERERLVDVAAKPLQATVSASRPDTMQFKFVLEKDGKYRVRFTSTDDEPSGDSIPYQFTVIPDLAPLVELKEPGKDTTLPANGVLSVAGTATDDYGLTQLVLKMRIVDGIELQPKVYRKSKDEGAFDFRFDDGTFPRSIDYKDFVELDKVNDTQGRVYPLAPGKVVEYWLEAIDNCDYPEPNIGYSKKFKVTIAKPEDPKKSEQQKNEAKKQQQEHNDNQDQQHAKDNRDKQKNQQQGNGNDQQKPPSQQDKDFRSKADNLRKEAEKERDRGDSKPDKNQDKGENKNQGKKPEGAKNAGNDKQPPRQGEGQNQDKPGEQKDNKPGEKPTPNDKKGGTKQQPSQGNQQNQPNQDQNNQNQQGENKQPPKQNQGAGGQKNAGNKPDGSKQAGSEKDPNQKPAGQDNAGNKKKEGNAGSGADKPGERKDNGQPGGAKDDSSRGKAGTKPAGPNDPKNSSAAAAKPGDPKDAGNGAEKPAPTGKQGQDNASTKDAGKPQADATAQDVKDAAKDLENSNGPGEGDAAKDLRDMAQNAKDPQVRKAAAKALEEHANKGKEATPQDVAKAAKDLQGDDAKKREQAADQLRHIAQNAKDAQARKDAEDALKKNGQPTASAGNDPKQPERDPSQNTAQGGTGRKPQTPEETAGQGKSNGKGDPKEQQGTSKEGNGQNKKETGTGKEPGKGQAPQGEPKEKGPEPQEGEAPGQGGRKNGPGGGEFNPSGQQGGDPLKPVELDPPAAASADELKSARRAGELQLDEFKKRVTPDMLKKVDMTPDQWKKFLQEYERRLGKLRAREKVQEKLEQPLVGSGPRPGPGVIKGRPGAGKRESLDNVGPLLPPAEFQNSYRDFTEELSRLKRKP